MLFLPLAPRGDEGGIVTVCPSCGATIDPTDAARGLALLRAEARRDPVRERREQIAIALLVGPRKRPEELAVEFGVSINTIRADLRALKGTP